MFVLPAPLYKYGSSGADGACVACVSAAAAGEGEEVLPQRGCQQPAELQVPGGGLLGEHQGPGLGADELWQI